MRKVATVAAAVLIACLGLGAPAHSFGIAELLSKVEGDSGFKVIHVTDLTAMRAKPGAKVVVYDANPPDVREEEGVIPGAHLLSSSGSYDVASELPADKSTPLVFYCHNTY
jgi:hypothetical protein